MRKNTRVVVLDDFTILYILLSIKFFNHSAAKLQKKKLFIRAVKKVKNPGFQKLVLLLQFYVKLFHRKEIWMKLLIPGDKN